MEGANISFEAGREGNPLYNIHAVLDTTSSAPTGGAKIEAGELQVSFVSHDNGIPDSNGIHHQHSSLG
jgi:hypothetical protein